MVCRVTFAYLCGYVCTQETQQIGHDQRGRRGQKFRPVQGTDYDWRASTSEEIAVLEAKAQCWIDHYGGQQTFDFEESAKAMEEIHRTISMIERTLQNAPQVILGHVYDRIGFNAIGDDILRHLAIARVCQPMSKVATVEYLKSYFDEDAQLHDIYRYMDRLYNTPQQEALKPLI